jgi:hypothetical protein
MGKKFHIITDHKALENIRVECLVKTTGLIDGYKKYKSIKS